MQDLIRLVEFDIRGENKVNYFTKEEIELKDKTCNFIIPAASPFFGEPENFKLYNAKGGELKLGKDYTLVGEFIPFCDVSGRSVVSFIELSDEVLKSNSKVFATYISIGAYFIPRGELDKWKDSLHKGKIPIDFEEKVHSIPEVLPPSHHLHNVREEITNWYDITYFYHYLYGLVKGKDRNILTTIDKEVDQAFALLNTYRNNEQSKLTKHDRDYDNPHSVVSKDIDLGNVPNIGVASPEEILSGKGDDKFLTSESVELLLNGEVEENKDLMLPGVYPISRFGTGGYIPPSISGSFEGLGHENFSIACLEEEDGLVFLAPRFDGKSRGLYYFKMENNVLIPTYHKYDHPFFRTNNVIPTTIYNNSGKDVMMVYDKAGGRLVIGNIGGTLNPEGHTWSFLTLPWGIDLGSATTVRLGRWVYVFRADYTTGAGVAQTVNFRMARFLFDRIGKDQLINAEKVEGLSYTNADGDVKNGTAVIELFKNVPATKTTSKQCFFNFTGVLPRAVTMNRYTSPVVKTSIGGGVFRIKFLTSFWVESVIRSMAGTIENVFEYNPENPKVLKYVGSSPKYTVTDGFRPSLPGHNPYLGWMFYGGTNQTCWFDEEKLIYTMGSSRSNLLRRVSVDDADVWLSESSPKRHIRNHNVSLANPLGFKPTLGSGVWGNGYVSFISLRDWDGALIRSGFKYNEGFKVRPEVYNESVKDLYSLPLPSKVKPIQLVNVPFRLASNMVPLSEHTTNNKGVPSFGKMFASTNFAVTKGEFSLKLPTKTVIKETEDSIVIEGTTDRTYTKAALESLLNHLKGPKPNWKEYPEVIIAIYEMDGEVAEGKGEVAKVPFFAVIDTYDGRDGINTVVLFNIDKNKLTINPTDIKVVKVLDFITPHSRPQNSGVSSSFKGNQPVYVKVSARDNGTYLITAPTVQHRETSGNIGLDGIIITCTGANTSNPQWASESGFWGGTVIFHGDLGIGVSPSESMALESFRRRDVTGGCSVMINNFLFASTYPQEGWIVYFPTEQDVLVSGSSYRLPIGSLDLRDFVTDPKDKVIYIYTSVENNKPFYYASLVEGARSVYHLLVAVVKTSKTKIESIERHQPIHIGDRKISKFREGAILPVSTGFPQDDGWFDHLDGEDLGIAKPGPEMPIPTGPVTKFDWRQEHGNVGEYSWTNPALDYSVEAYVNAGYFEDDVQHYIEQGYDLSKYRLVISEWFTYVGQTGEPNNKTTHPLMTFVHDDIKKRFKTGFVKPRADYDKSDYLHIMDTYLPTRIERKDKSDVGIIVPHRIEDDEIKSKVSNYEVMTGIGPIANNFGEYFDVESKSLKNTDWWTSGVDFDFNRMVIKLSPFNSGGDGLDRENEFTKEYITLRTKLEKENKYLHEFYFKPQIPFQKPNPSKVVGMFAASKTERYIDKPAQPPNGKKLPSIVVKPGNGLLSKGVTKGDLEKNIRGSWWEPILNNSVTDDRKFYDGKGYNADTHDLHYYIWEDVTWDGSNARDMYNHINSRKGKDRIRVDLNHFRQAQRYFATIVSLPKGHKFDGSRMQITMINTPEVSAAEANQLIGRLGFGTVDSGFGNLFLNPINQVKHKDWYDGSVNWNATILQLGVWPIVTRNGGGTLQEQRARAYNSDYLPRRNELVRTNESVFEHWFETETTWKGKTIGGILITGKLLTVAPASSDNALINVRVIPGNFGSYRTLDGWNERTYVRLDNNPRKLEEQMQGWINEFNRGGMLTDAQYAEILEVNRLNGEFALLGISRTAYYEFKKAGYTKDSHVLELTPWSEPSAELDHGGRDPRGKRDMHRLATMRGYQRVTVPEWITRAFPAPINANGTFYGYKLVPRYEQLNSDIPFEIQNGDVGTLDQVNQLIAACGLGDFKNAWGRFFLRTSRQLKPVDWYSGDVNWAHNKLVFKVWQLNDITAHPGNIRQNAINRNSGFYNLYVPKRDRLIGEHKYVFEHWFPDDLTMNGKVVSGIFITAHVERTAEPPRIIRHQFWFGSRYHKGHVDSCVNKNVVSSYGFDSFPSCRVNVGLEPDSPRPHRYAMAGLFSIPDNCHIVSMYQTNGGYYGLSWRYTNNYAAPGTRNIEILQTTGTILTIVIGNEVGETITYKLNIG